mgnify:CR=1 FL=1
MGLLPRMQIIHTSGHEEGQIYVPFTNWTLYLAVGGLVDVAGSDAYVMHSGLGQGGSHDFAASVLHARGGNDRYHGNTSCNGCGLTNAVGLHLDRAGDDTYAARRDGGIRTRLPPSLRIREECVIAG